MNACKDCEAQFIGKNRGVQCNFCENLYCQKCSKLKQTLFNEIGKQDGLFFSCAHCRIAMPSLQKVLAKLVSFEQRIEHLEKPNAASELHGDKDMIRQVIREEKDEEQERENRKLNVIINSLPESKETTPDEKKDDDKSRVNMILNDILHLDVSVHNVFRLGKFSAEKTKPRPLRLSVSDFDSKRKILNASRLLKNHQMYSSVYLTPDLTPRQRKEAFDLREEKRRREKNGHRTVSIWNSLPQDLVNCKTVCAFKSNLDKLWRHKRFDVSDVY